MTRMTAAQAKKLVKSSNTKTKSMLSQLGSIGEETLARHLQVHQIKFVREYRFNPITQHRSDFYLPNYNLLVEVEGGTKNKSRHTTHKGYSEDLRKYNMAQILGFSRLAFTTEQVSAGDAIETIHAFITAHNFRRIQNSAEPHLSNIKQRQEAGLIPDNAGVPDAIMQAQHTRPEHIGV